MKGHGFQMTIFKRSLIALLLLLSTCAELQAQRGALVAPRNLGQLVEQSAVVVRGRVASARVEAHPQFANIHTVLITLAVDKTFKGVAPSIMTVRQFIWDARDVRDGAGYMKGQTVMLLLNAPTKLGMQSTAGLDQGRFRVLKDSSGVEIVANGNANQFLFRGLDAYAAAKGVTLSAKVRQTIAAPPEKLTLSQLEEMITMLAGVHK